jgi:hypothetical protein
MSSMFGTFRASEEYGEVATIGNELESVSAAMYVLSQKRVATALDRVIPMMNKQMRRDVSHAGMWAGLAFDSASAFAGVGNDLYAEAAAQLQSVRYGLPKYMSPSLQASAVTTLLSTARMHTLFKGMAYTGEYERLRKYRDDGLAMLFRHIEIATGIRGIADTLANAAVADIGNGARERLSEKVHTLNMQKIDWEKQRQMQALKDSSDNALGSLGGDLLGGVIKGMMF